MSKTDNCLSSMASSEQLKDVNEKLKRSLIKEIKKNLWTQKTK